MYVKASGRIKRGSVDLHVYSINYTIIYKNYVVTISSMINSFDDNLNYEKSKYEMLSESIISSLIFKDKW